MNDGVAELGKLDIIVGNAGICIVAPWDQVTPEIFKDTLDVNVTGTWNTVMAGAPHLVANGGGRSSSPAPRPDWSACRSWCPTWPASTRSPE